MDRQELSGRDWLVVFGSDAIQVDLKTISLTHDRFQVTRLDVQRKWFRYFLLRDGEPLAALSGCRKSDALELAAWLQYWELLPYIDDAVRWREEVEVLLTSRLEQGRWIPLEEVDQINSHCPARDLQDQSRSNGCESLLTAEQLEAARFVATGIEVRVRVVNEQVMESELTKRRAFFDSIERTPLSEEQARAVVCFDNRVQVLAAAGSGKTSVMVARAAYAVDRGFVPPDRVLLLGFNRAAASELQERIESRFTAAGIPSEGVKASTFHAFGLEVIGSATGKKPRLARWLEQGDDLAMTIEIVDHLRDGSEDFRYNWDLYRLLFANASTRLDDDSPDGYDSVSRTTGYRTFSGTLVKSHGERLIADFLFLSGVLFEYERPFAHDVADVSHSQYRPDFYYPGIDVWHEHWALDRDGHPPRDFTGYAKEMQWKRNLHTQLGTKLIETTWAEVMFEDGLKRLQDELTHLGIEFDWNPDRPSADPWAKPLKHEDLARLVRTFMCHVKSNSWSALDLERRLGGEMRGLNGFRTRLFLSCYWPIHEEWERRLREEDSVDFEDMLVNAADLLEEGAVSLPYELVMVDEFQDSSQARARFVRGLLKAPGRYLLAVGDDWQSINRFAGADVSVMNQFSKWFGRGPQLTLTTTFRCSQEICDVARGFVSKNPIQFDKSMQSVATSPGRPVTVVLTDDESRAIVQILNRVSAEVLAGSPSGNRSDLATVNVLGRYGFQREVLPKEKWEGLNVTFRTVHGSKGLEADFVIIPGMSTGTFGFPSNVADDPVLELAMPTPDTYPHAEERRLFYVALTRARCGVFILASLAQPSTFVVELLLDPKVIVESPGGSSVIVCPSCRQGTLVERHGPYDPFLGCTMFPVCRHKDKVVCPGCGNGTLVQRRGPYGPFIGCSRYPGCTHTAKIKAHATS
jgi:DNA helicase-4